MKTDKKLIVDDLDCQDLAYLMRRCLKHIEDGKSYEQLKKSLHQVLLATECIIIKNEFEGIEPK